MSYANADETKTFCVYEGPSEAAVRKAKATGTYPEFEPLFRRALELVR